MCGDYTRLTYLSEGETKSIETFIALKSDVLYWTQKKSYCHYFDDLLLLLIFVVDVIYRYMTMALGCVSFFICSSVHHFSAVGKTLNPAAYELTGAFFYYYFFFFFFEDVPLVELSACT